MGGREFSFLGQADLHCLQAVLSCLLAYSYFFFLSLIVRYEVGGKAKGIMWLDIRWVGTDKILGQLLDGQNVSFVMYVFVV